MKNKLITCILVGVIALTSVACGGNKIVEVDKDGDGKLNIVCTMYPVYDWVQIIGGDRVEPNFLLDSGIDLHNYQPTVDDMITMKESDLLIYVGGDSDTWTKDVVDNSFNSLNLIELMGDDALDQEMVEGMQEHDHDHDHDHSIFYEIYAWVKSLFGYEDDHDHSHDTPDEHVWMSVKKAKVLVQGIVDELVEIDAEYADLYIENGSEYLEKLEALDETYEVALGGISKNTIIVADRFPLLYLTQDYGLEYFAAFSGCSAEAEVSFETITFLKEKVEELELEYIFKIDGSNQQIANTVIDDEAKVLEINSMQTITSDQMDKSYIDIMEENLEELLIGLK